MKTNKRRMLIVVTAVLLLAFALALTGCGKSPDSKPTGGTTPPEEDPSAVAITGITYEDATVTYDGEEHSILVSGVLPDGVSVQYSGNKGTLPGTYNATATLSGTGYKTLTLSATLTIQPLTITGITYENVTVDYDGTEHELTVTGTLPQGVSVQYSGNKGTLPDTYNATATLSGTGYATLTLNATLTIQPLIITGVTYENATVTYDHDEHELTVTGTLPQGVSVQYSGNKGTLPNTYNATATLSGTGYQTLTLNATLTIEKANLTGITFDNQSFAYDGTPHSLEIAGMLPQGVTVRYENNTATDAGKYTAKAILSGDGYNTLELSATLTITASERELAIYGDGNTLYFANALDGEKLYKYTSEGIVKVSSDVPYDFTKMGGNMYFRSGTLFASRIKTIGETGVDYVASQKGEYLCTDGSNLYFANNALKAENSGIYKLSLGGSDPVVTLLSQGKAKYLQCYGGKLYFADGNNGWKLGSISTSGGARTNVVDEKITCLTQKDGVLYFTVDNLLGNYIARYSVSGRTLRKLTSDAGANLTVIGDKLYYVNVDLLSSYLHGKGIYTVNENASVDSNAAGTKVIGAENETYTSLTAVGSKLAYYKVSNQMLCLTNTDGSGEVEILDGFVAPETTPPSTGSKVLAHNNMIYFMDVYNDKALYSYNPQTEAFLRLTANKVADFAIIGDMLYFNEVTTLVNNDLYSVNLRTGGEAEFVSTYDANDIVTDGENVYYVEKNAAGVRTAIRKVGADGNDPMLYSKGATNLTYYDGYLYFVDGKDLLRISVSDPSYTVLTVKKGNTDAFVISDGVVYFREMYGVGWALKRLSRINVDGTGYTKMMTADTDPLYIQVVDSTVYYYSDITANGKSGIYSISIHATENETPKLVLARDIGNKSYYAEQFAVLGNKIYFVNYYNMLGDSHLYRVDITTSVLEKVA